jgi:Protein of unknown function (DUF4239)
LSPLSLSCLAFACILGGALLGMILGRALPALSGESKDAVKLGLTLIATLTALVLGLLIASAKGTYDTQNSAVKEMAAKVILLDRTLALYGPETKEARGLLRRAGARTLDRLWPDDSARSADLAPGEARAEMELFYDKVAALAPAKDVAKHAALRARALDITTDLFQTRLRLFAQRDSSVPLPFLVVLVVWLVVLFTGYGLIMPRNATVLAVLVVCILSVSGALFLILELDSPFDGILRISSASVRDALSQVGE